MEEAKFQILNSAPSSLLARQKMLASELFV
jgi:hypothetical protein